MYRVLSNDIWDSRSSIEARDKLVSWGVLPTVHLLFEAPDPRKMASLPVASMAPTIADGGAVASISQGPQAEC